MKTNRHIIRVLPLLLLIAIGIGAGISSQLSTQKQKNRLSPPRAFEEKNVTIFKDSDASPLFQFSVKEVQLKNPEGHTSMAFWTIHGSLSGH